MTQILSDLAKGLQRYGDLNNGGRGQFQPKLQIWACHSARTVRPIALKKKFQRFQSKLPHTPNMNKFGEGSV